MQLHLEVLGKLGNTFIGTKPPVFGSGPRYPLPNTRFSNELPAMLRLQKQALVPGRGLGTNWRDCCYSPFGKYGGQSFD